MEFFSDSDRSNFVSVEGFLRKFLKFANTLLEGKHFEREPGRKRVVGN